MEKYPENKEKVNRAKERAILYRGVLKYIKF